MNLGVIRLRPTPRVWYSIWKEGFLLMRKLLAGIPVLALAVAFIASGQQQPQAPASFTIPAKNGAILFNHAEHVKHAKNDCKACHPDPWPQSKTAPINFRPPHSTAVSKQQSCGKCHRPQGTAFAANLPANCKKCHGTAPKAGS